MIEQALESMNLSKKEQSIYLTLLREESLSIQEISKKTGINRTFCYELTNSLLNKGMIASTIQAKGKKYIATQPKSLLLLIKEKEEIIKEAIPELEELNKSRIELPKIEVFEGNKGIKAVMSEILNAKEEIIGYSSKEFIEYLNYYLPNFAKERAKNKIPLRLILNDMEWTREWLSKFKDKEELRKVKFQKLSKDFESTTYIFDKHTAIITISKKAPVAMLIEDRDYAATQRMIFEKMWN